MNLVAEEKNGALLITFRENRLDAASAIQFKDRMRELTQTAPARVVLDMSLVSFLDSSGLGAIVAVLKKIKQGTSMELAGLTPTVQKVFHLTRMDTIFKIHPDTEVALNQNHVL